LPCGQPGDQTRFRSGVCSVISKARNISPNVVKLARSRPEEVRS